MSITTEEFALTKDEYLGLLVSMYFKWRWPLTIGLAAMAVYTLVYTKHTVPGIGTAACAILYPSYILWYAWRFATCDENRNLYERRQFRFENEVFHAEMAGGSESNIRYEYVIRVDLTKRHYLLYISKSQFICVPIRAFQTNDDRRAFESLLQTHNLI